MQFLICLYRFCLRYILIVQGTIKELGTVRLVHMDTHILFHHVYVLPFSLKRRLPRCLRFYCCCHNCWFSCLISWNTYSFCYFELKVDMETLRVARTYSSNTTTASNATSSSSNSYGANILKTTDLIFIKNLINWMKLILKDSIIK